MHFFRSREDADGWLVGRGELAILSIEEGCELGQEHWVRPAERGRASCKVVMQ